MERILPLLAVIDPDILLLPALLWFRIMMTVIPSYVKYIPLLLYVLVMLYFTLRYTRRVKAVECQAGSICGKVHYPGYALPAESVLELVLERDDSARQSTVAVARVYYQLDRVQNWPFRLFFERQDNNSGRPYTLTANIYAGNKRLFSNARKIQLYLEQNIEDVKVLMDSVPVNETGVQNVSG